MYMQLLKMLFFIECNCTSTFYKCTETVHIAVKKVMQLSNMPVQVYASFINYTKMEFHYLYCVCYIKELYIIGHNFYNFNIHIILTSII